MSARFVDELLFGAVEVLLPTLRRAFGLGLFQVGLLLQVLEWVALGVEPLAASTIDHSSRRRLLAGGAAAVTAAILLMAAASSYAVLLLGFAAYGVGSGPLCHTADVVVTESFPDDADRAYGRATVLDTCGALLGPAVVALTLLVGASWRWALLACCAVGAVHTTLSWRSSLPPPSRSRAEGHSLLREFAVGARQAVAHPALRRALAVLFAFDLLESAFLLEYVWLHDEAGVPEAGVAVWAMGEQAVAILALLALDRLLQRHAAEAILRAAAAALVVLPAAWAIAPGIAGKAAASVPIAIATAMIWPLAKSASLTAAPELAGAAQAVSTLFPVIPLAFVQSWLADATGLGAAMAVTAASGAGAVLLLVRLPAPPAYPRRS